MNIISVSCFCSGLLLDKEFSDQLKPGFRVLKSTRRTDEGTLSLAVTVEIGGGNSGFEFVTFPVHARCQIF